MDCFGMLNTFEQVERIKQRKVGDKDIIRHIVIKDVTVRDSFPFFSLLFYVHFSFLYIFPIEIVVCYPPSMKAFLAFLIFFN
jgi:hypothetical protein